MKIGIDAKWFFKGPPSGTVVIRNIVEQILKLETEDEFFIFLNKSDRSNNFPFKNEKIKLIYVKDSNSILANLIWIPISSRGLGLDVILYQNFPSFFGSKKNINYIHDILFFDYPQFFTLKERIYLRPIRFLSKFSDYIITISNSEKQRIIKHRLANSENIAVVYHGVEHICKNYSNEKIEAFNERYNLPNEFVLYLGRLNSRKNICNLLRAMAEVSDEIHLVIAGGKDHKMFDIDQFINKLDLKKRVTLVGFVPDEDIDLFYSKAKIFCFPSYAEGFGLPPLEAMAHGTPTIVSNTTSMPEICGDAALFVDPDNYKDMAKKISQLMRDEDLFNKHVLLGKRQTQMFKREYVGQQIYDIIKSVVNGNTI